MADKQRLQAELDAASACMQDVLSLREADTQRQSATHEALACMRAEKTVLEEQPVESARLCDTHFTARS